jgi:hypothetical protein
MIRDVLMLVYGAAWLLVVLVTAWRDGVVPPELWAVLGVGEGALIAIFKADRNGHTRRRPRPKPRPHDEEVAP